MSENETPFDVYSEEPTEAAGALSAPAGQPATDESERESRVNTILESLRQDLAEPPGLDPEIGEALSAARHAREQRPRHRLEEVGLASREKARNEAAGSQDQEAAAPVPAPSSVQAPIEVTNPGPVAAGSLGAGVPTAPVSVPLVPLPGPTTTRISTALLAYGALSELEREVFLDRSSLIGAEGAGLQTRRTLEMALSTTERYEREFESLRAELEDSRSREAGLEAALVGASARIQSLEHALLVLNGDDDGDVEGGAGREVIKGHDDLRPAQSAAPVETEQVESDEQDEPAAQTIEAPVSDDPVEQEAIAEAVPEDSDGSDDDDSGDGGAGQELVHDDESARDEASEPEGEEEDAGDDPEEEVVEDYEPDDADAGSEPPDELDLLPGDDDPLSQY